MSVLHHCKAAAVVAIPFELLVQSNTYDGDTLFTDSSGNRSITVIAPAAHTTDYAYFGSSSMYMGTGYITAGSIDLGLSDFTIDFRVRTTNAAGLYNYGYFNVGTGADFGLQINKLAVSAYIDGSAITTNKDILTDRWAHIAIMRKDGIFYQFHHGSLVAIKSDKTEFSIPSALMRIGIYQTVTAKACLIEEFAVRMQAVWPTGNIGDEIFTPPTTPYEA